jgi:hypothetical protein
MVTITCCGDVVSPGFLLVVTAYATRLICNTYLLSLFLKRSKHYISFDYMKNSRKMGIQLGFAILIGTNR